jgi:hypothetical protein
MKLVFVAMAGLALAGCASKDSGDDDAVACTASCAGGLRCVEGYCMTADCDPRTGADCGGGRFCLIDLPATRFSCRAPGSLASDACTPDQDCIDGACIDGHCHTLCNPSNPNDCGPPRSCTRITGFSPGIGHCH